MARNYGGPSAEALEHYQLILSLLKDAVKTAEDSYSDGIFLCHFLLLIYEVNINKSAHVAEIHFANTYKIVGSDHAGSSMFQHHMDQLLKIVVLRRHSERPETFEFIVMVLLFSSPPFSSVSCRHNSSRSQLPISFLSWRHASCVFQLLIPSS